MEKSIVRWFFRIGKKEDARKLWLRSFYDLTDIGIHRVGAREAYLCEYVFRVTRDTERTLYPPRGRPNIRKLHDDGPLRHWKSLLALAVFAATCKIGW